MSKVSISSGGSTVVITPQPARPVTIQRAGVQGRPGGRGHSGWSPVLASVVDNARRVLRVVSWSGGAGDMPATGEYVGPSGLVPTPSEATDVRGPAGPMQAVSALGVSGNLADAVGLLPDVRLPGRLGVGATANVVTDNANNILQAQGWGMINTAAINSPGEFTFTQFWGAQNNGFVIAVHPQSGRAYFRTSGATWQTGWTRLRWTDADMDTRYMPAAAAYNALGSTVFARINYTAVTATGSPVPGSALYPAGLNASGGVVSHGTAIGVGTWVLCSSGYGTVDTNQYGLFRRIA